MNLTHVALAFESGGDAQACSRTLEALRTAGVRATIFLDGRWAEANPNLLHAMAADGHELGNHAYAHPDLTALSAEQIVEELQRTEEIAVRLTGRSTRPWFRPPFQQLDGRVRCIAEQQGFRSLVRDALDGTHYLGPSTPEAILERSLAAASDGAVLTYHLQNSHTGAVLPQIIAQLRARGVTLVPVSELPTVPSERAPLHQDFTGVQVDPGYLRMHRPAPPPQMINMLALGTDVLAPVDCAQRVGQVSEGAVFLFVFNGRESRKVFCPGSARQVACLAGEVVLEAVEAGALICTALLRPGDALEVPQGWTVQALPSVGHQRAVLLIVE